jgi:hypothetical protein
MGTGSRRARASSHSPADDMKLWQHHVDRRQKPQASNVAGIRTWNSLELVGKTIKQVRFTAGDSQWTTLVMEFDDKTRASFHLTADVHLAMAPEISGTAKNGDIDNWMPMHTRRIMPHIS